MPTNGNHAWFTGVASLGLFAFLTAAHICCLATALNQSQLRQPPMITSLLLKRMLRVNHSHYSWAPLVAFVQPNNRVISDQRWYTVSPVLSSQVLGQFDSLQASTASVAMVQKITSVNNPQERQQYPREQQIELFSYTIPSQATTNHSTVTTINTLPLLRYSPVWTVALCVAYLVVFFLGLVGNLSVLWVIFILRRNSRHSMFATCNKVFNGLIGNLALADLLVIIFCLPATLISNIFTPYFLGRFVCKAVQYFQGVSVSASIYTLVAISIDRFYGIYYPFNNGFSQLVRRTMITFIWFFSFVIAIPWILFFDLVELDEYSDSILMCQEVWPDETLPDVYFLVVNFGLQYLVPLSIILVFYMLLMMKIWKRRIPVFHSTCRRETSTDTVDQWNARIVEQSKMKVLKMLIVIVSLFALSWLPLYLIFLYLKFGNYDETSSFDNLVISITPLAQWLGASNSCVNPILYFFFNAKFRAYLKKAITRSFLCSSSIEFTRNPYYNNYTNNNIQPATAVHLQHQQQPQHITNGHNHTLNQVNCDNHKISPNTLLHCANNNNNSNILQTTNNHSAYVASDNDNTVNGKVSNLDQVVDTVRMYCCQTGKASPPFNSQNSSPKGEECEQNETDECNRLIVPNEHKNGIVQARVCVSDCRDTRCTLNITMNHSLGGSEEHLDSKSSKVHFGQNSSLRQPTLSRETPV